MSKKLVAGAIVGKSEYSEFLNELLIAKCTSCNGTGECDDAEPGDIGFDRWVCCECKGTGLIKTSNNIFISMVEISDTIEALKS